MNWRESHRADRRANRLAKRHYTCQTPASNQFVKPGGCLVLVTKNADALWVTSRQKAEFTDHAWAGAWECSLFRNEGRLLSSTLISEAVAATVAYYGAPPPLGMITMIDPRKVTGFLRRTAKGVEMSWGYSFQRAGFEFAGWTKSGKYVLQLLPEKMPAASPHVVLQASMFSEAA